MVAVHVQDKVVLITGAGSPRGIGRALAEQALAMGAKKVYVGARGPIPWLEGQAGFEPITLDVTNANHIADAVQQCFDTDVLINNAGVASTSGCVHAFDEDHARLEMEVNYFAPLRLIHAFAPMLIAHQGAIVNIASIGGLYPAAPFATYCASKAAVHSLTQAVRAEMRPHAVGVFGVYPGPIATDMAAALDDPKKGRTDVLAERVYRAMSLGQLDITTDEASDQFANYLAQFTEPAMPFKMMLDF